MKQQSGQATGNDPSEEAIVERVFDAIIERQLPPGHKLSEQALGQAFGVGRMRIRRSLLLLASRGVVDLHTNRGAFVAKPSIAQARAVFEARIEVEPNVTRLAVKRANSADIQALQQHLLAERAAHIENNRREAIRLSGQFHILIARIAGNEILTKLVRELITRTSLIIGIYGSVGDSDCRDNDHQDLLQAFSDQKPEQAARLMLGHLRSIEEHLDFQPMDDHDVNLEALFAL